MLLIEKLDTYLEGLYPPESNHLLDIEGLAGADVRFFVARREDGVALGCGAIRIDPAGYGEVKRMYVAPEARGRRLGVRLLRHVEEEARRAGLTCLRLEVGIHQPEALGLYHAEGYRPCEPFASYVEDPLSIYMEKPLP
jgi:putative acetyltransferase